MDDETFVLDRREIELNQRHEEILARREALLAAEESYFDYEMKHGHSFIAGFTQAMKRNEGLTRDLEEFLSEVRGKSSSDSDPKFQRISNNYWSMVRSVYPVWTEELREFKKRRNERRSVEISEDFDPVLPEDLPPLSGRGNSMNRSEPGLRKSVSIDPVPKYTTA